MICVWIVGFLSLTLGGIVRGAESLEKEPLRHGKICIGTNGRMSKTSNPEHHYRNLRDRYTNCTYVDGNLELTWLQDENYDLSFLQHIREVTGYVLISHVDVRRIVLPSLQIIRGRTLFKLNVHENEFALIVTLSKMLNLELPALRDILEGSVGILNNYNLCHIKTIKWNEIITGQNAKYVYVYKFNEPERDCTPCHETCQEGCWGEGSKNCQKFSKINCSPQCHQGRCFGPQPRECCHLFCAGGCTGPKQSDCLACRNFYDDGVCKQECPPMQRYNPIKYKWEKNPDGKYAYGATCVKDCPKHLLKDNGACVRVCPPDKKTVNGECVSCNGPCPKTCIFSDTVHAGNINSLKNCTVVEGSLMILENSFDGFQNFYENFTFGPRYPAMDPGQLEVLSSIKEVTGFINIQAHHPNFTNLDAFRNLEIIGGRHLTEFFSSLLIIKSSLVSLNLRSLKEIRSGSVTILENQDLCYSGQVDWKRIMKSFNHNALLQNNRPQEKCILESKTCDPQCSSHGCWGPGKGMCLTCKNFAVENECVGSCDPNLGLYRSSKTKNQCMKCHPECDLTCTGPGPGSCDACKNTKDGPFCVKECPRGKYDDNGECKECHKNCASGCKGPKNTVGPDGCNSCDKVILNGEYGVDQCLEPSQDCPDGYYLDWVSRQVAATTENLDELEGKAICRPCHPWCKRCTGYGFHKEVCLECKHLEQDEQCTEECSANHYIGPQNTCLACHDECRECRGPSSFECLACRNFKVFTSENNATIFNCTKTCPENFPYKVYTPEVEDHPDPYCSAVHVATGHSPSRAETGTGLMIGGIVVTVVFCFLLSFVFIACKYKKRRDKQEMCKKITLAMTGCDDHEPLRPTNISPNLAQLRIIKDHELLQGEMLGCGAFGAVHKGFWIPEGENVKIPVAIKVLHDSNGINSSNAILEEAKIMASIEHPNLLKLLAVSMTSRLMLVTQLMPLGCLLQYVRKHKDNIGSKHLLNWCVQIAKGMAYLEDKRLVHRDLAARNVLVQKPTLVKITDFGLAKLLDANESEYKAQGGKMPIKWLAIECIRKKVFTHKSDVWAYGVTVWELLTHGKIPYENYKAEQVPDLLEKGERLPQPQSATIDIFMLMIKCWMVDPDSRPSFKELVTEFTNMARDPGRYLVIPGDKLMRLPEFTPQDERELIAQSNLGGSEPVIAAEEYFNPGGRMSSQHTLNTPVETPLPPATPTQKFFPPGMTLPSELSHRNSAVFNRHSKYGSSVAIPDGFSTLGSRSLRHSNMFSPSCDPLKALEDMPDGMPSSLTTAHNTMFSQRSNGSTLHSYPRPPTKLPVDDEGYLEPSPKSPTGFKPSTPTANNAYMELIHDNGGTMFQYPPPQGYFLTDNPSNYGRVPDHGAQAMGMPASIDNLEYILTSKASSSKGDYHTLGIPLVGSANNGSPASSQGPSSIHSVTSNPPNSGKPPSLTSNGSSGQRSAGLNGVILKKPETGDGSNHEYYNDFDRFHRPDIKPLKLQPPPAAKHETTV